MTKLEKLLYLNKFLLNEDTRYKEQAKSFAKNESDQTKLFRSLVNLRMPKEIDRKFLEVQDEFLKQETLTKGIVHLSDLEEKAKNIYLWQGDITRLAVDAIVNAANSAMLGCFIPCHSCIDNAIHFYAGVQLRLECDKIMQQQCKEEPTGKAKITKAYNLPCENIIHTVGPIVRGDLTKKDCDLLANCYKECLKTAVENGLSSIAFCCISTGEFHFPNDKASIIAVNTVKEFLRDTKSDIKVIFNVFKNEDRGLYEQLLS